ncbi:hypothetical protein GKZ89_11250 [Bacillus mangrovi]|uniref:Uncharacterized protein n=1 Tax=Metabacillus mangrovi TaxID=1491830 RepID=A0A7X2V5F2_9BACI|nr:DUF6188 family protein [Metabacillus mangrovi]MTH53983.1 hypothetical protein [Metabacillus mangrovi]
MNESLDFPYFKGQKIAKLETGNPLPLILHFTKGGLVIECPWRLKLGGKIVVGLTDFQTAETKKDYLDKLTALLAGQEIQNVCWWKEAEILRIKTANGAVLDVFHNSASFEGWELFGDNEFSFISLPGGEVENI